MQPLSNPNSSENLRIQPLFLKPYESRDNVIDSCPRFGHNNIPIPNGDQEMKITFPLLSSQHKSSSYILAPPENPRGTVNLDKAIEFELKHDRKLDPRMDEKKLRRIVSNRLSAERARVKKNHYINVMEQRTKDLEGVVSGLAARVESYKELRKQLMLQNDSLQRLLGIRLNEAKLSESKLEKNRAELARLNELKKTLSKIIHDSNGGGQQMQDLNISEQFITQQYMRHGFSENSLEPKQLCQEQVASSGPEQATSEDQQPAGFETKVPVAVSTPKKDQEEVAVDQYLNLED